MLGAAGGVETAICALVVARGVVPPTINYTTPDPECDLDYVPDVGRRAEIEAAVCNTIAFGSKNSALVLTRA